MGTFPADKWYEKITFLPDPALTDEQKGFLRTVFPADLLAEIDQTSALGIITNSSLAPMVTSRLLLVPLVCRERAFEDSSVGKLRARLSIKMLPSLR